MNKQSSSYTIIYIIVLVVLVGSALAWVATALKPEQIRNADADKMKQILAAVHIAPGSSSMVAETFNKHITGIVVDQAGNVVDNAVAFDVDVATQSHIADTSKRLLPVYIFNDSQVGTKYILPLYGQGLWGPIWGYIALDDNGSTVYGAYFSHQGETPGLGAEIEKPAFQDQFINKEMFKNNEFLPINVLKKGLKSAKGEDYVDAISGGTITSKGVGAMLDNCLAPYKSYLESLTVNN